MKHSKKIWVLFINELYKNIENTGGKVWKMQFKSNIQMYTIFCAS